MLLFGKTSYSHRAHVVPVLATPVLVAPVLGVPHGRHDRTCSTEARELRSRVGELDLTPGMSRPTQTPVPTPTGSTPSSSVTNLVPSFDPARLGPPASQTFRGSPAMSRFGVPRTPPVRPGPSPSGTHPRYTGEGRRSSSRARPRPHHPRWERYLVQSPVGRPVDLSGFSGDPESKEHRLYSSQRPEDVPVP